MKDFKDYLGDGVYAYFDGYHILLATQQGDKIALEPSVLFALNRYNKRIREKELPDDES